MQLGLKGILELMVLGRKFKKSLIFSSPTVSVGTVTNLSFGSSPYVTNTGSSSGAIFNFGIPAGATGATGATGANGTNALPSDFSPVMWHDAAKVTSGASIVLQASSLSYYYSTISAQVPNALNDSFYYDFVMLPGTYTLNVAGNQTSESGIVSWYIDNTLQGTQDWYISSSGRLIQTLSVTVPSGYNHTLKGVMASKNASSGGYACFLTRYFIN